MSLRPAKTAKAMKVMKTAKTAKTAKTRYSIVSRMANADISTSHGVALMTCLLMLSAAFVVSNPIKIASDIMLNTKNISLENYIAYFISTIAWVIWIEAVIILLLCVMLIFIHAALLEIDNVINEIDDVVNEIDNRDAGAE